MKGIPDLPGLLRRGFFPAVSLARSRTARAQRYVFWKKMSRKVQRVPCRLDAKSVKQLPIEELRIILRGADDIIGQGGRSLLSKILKGSRAQEVLNLHFDQNPVYGYYRGAPEEEVLAKIDRTILDGYLRIMYDYRLPLLAYTDAGWAIEKETYAIELLQGFEELLTASQPPYDMGYLKDRSRALIWCLLDKVEASQNPQYLPLLKAWQETECKKVRQRIQQVTQKLGNL